MAEERHNYRLADGKNTLRLPLGYQQIFFSVLTATERRLRLKSNGISSTLSYPTMAGGSCFKIASSRGLLTPPQNSCSDRSLQDVLVILSLEIHVAVQHNLTFGECACFISA